jgi:tetratricopeptide (TPR) repeat protein
VPDWGSYRAAFLRGDLKAQNLERLQTMESWLYLPFADCLAAAQKRFAGQSEDELRPWYQLSRVLYLKLMREAGFGTPETMPQMQALFEACQSGKATPQQFHTATGLVNIDRISTVMTQLYPNIGQPTAGMLAGTVTREKIGPISARLLRLNTVPGLVNAATVKSLQAILAELEQLCQEAAPDNTGRPDVLNFCGEAALALGTAYANLGDSQGALAWYGKSAAFFDEANDAEKAGQSRQKAAALELDVTGDIDRATQKILGPLFDPAHPPEPLSLAMAYADLSGVMRDAGDVLGAGEAAGRAAADFENLGFKDPEKVGVEAALDSWVAQVCKLAFGTRVFVLLMKICDAYLAVFSGREAQYAASDPERAQHNTELTSAMGAILSQIRKETAAAESGLSQAINAYFVGEPVLVEEPPEDNSFQHLQQSLAKVDDALLQLRHLTDQRQSAGQPMQPVLTMLDELGPLVQATQMPLYQAKWKLGYAYTLMAAGETQHVLEAAEKAGTVLLGGRPAKLSSFQKTFERALYLEALLQKMRALMMLGQLKAGLELCLETIADFETRRYRVNSPLRQSTLLQSIVEFYTGAAFAAFKLNERDTLLQVTELVKARSAIRSRLSAEIPEVETEALAKQFGQITAEIQVSKKRQDQAKLNDLMAQRRDIWDLMAIARARAAGAAQPGLVSIEAIQAVLGSDEAMLGYFFLGPSVLLIMKMDRERFEVERIIFKENEMAPVNELLDAIERLDESGPLDLDAAIAVVGGLLLPAGVRTFLEGKARVIISPHHGLHLFPFHAASWGGKFLMERCAVRYIPNFSSLLLEWHGQSRTGAFALGVSRFEVPGQAWPELKNTEEQARTVAGIYARLNLPSETLTGERATIEAFRRLASTGGLSVYSTLHLATHGTSVFASDTQDEPMESKLVLENGWIDGLELARYHLPAEVAVLSACNSGQRAVSGRGMSELPGDDIFGLQSALFQAGVHTVLGSLWPVETHAAYEITSEFHSNYAQGDPAEIALQKAALRLCAANERGGTFLWAPFFLSSLGTAKTSGTVH